MKEHGPSKIPKNENIKTEYVINYEIEVKESRKGEWYTRRYGLESLNEAYKYLAEHSSWGDDYRIVKREVTTVTTLVEMDDKDYEMTKQKITDTLLGCSREKRKKLLQHFADLANSQ
jgi:hypothetical protein